MDVSTLVALLRRNLGVAFAGLAALIATCGYVVTAVPLSQRVTGSVVLIAPSLTAAQAVELGQIGAQNPLLGFSDALLVNANLLVKVMSSPEYGKQLTKEGATASYVLATSNDGVVPLVSVTAKSPSAATSMRTAQIVLQAVHDELYRRQTAVGAPQSTFIRTEVAVAPSSGGASWSGRITKLAEGGAVVVIGTFLLVMMADRLTTRRGLRRKAGDEMEAETIAGDAEDDPDVAARRAELQRRYRDSARIRVSPVSPLGGANRPDPAPRRPRPPDVTTPNGAARPTVTPGSLEHRTSEGPDAVAAVDDAAAASERDTTPVSSGGARSVLRWARR